ncbi:MAG TPA: MFS transporter [Verrucomicrobiae bacterium]|nr:MFS transporter [Verrucomicrobiae bacterium]
MNHARSNDNSPYKWLVVGLLWLVCFFNYADRQAIFSVFPVLRKEMGLTDVQLGIVGGAFMWLYALALPLAGLVGDRVSRKVLIIGGLIFWSLVTLATAWSTKYWHLVVCRSLEGFGEAFYFPASMSLISDYHSPETRSRAMSLHQSSVYAGTIAGGFAAGFFADHYGWRSGFHLFGSLGVLLGVALLACLREPARGQSESTVGSTTVSSPTPFPVAVREVPNTPMVLVLMATFVGANFVAAIFLTWMPSFLNKEFKMSLTMSGLNATAWLQIASVIGVLTGGYLADQFARTRREGRMLTQVTGLLLGVPFIFLTGWTLSIPVLILAMVGFGFFKGLYDANIWASLYDVVRVERRSTALGLMNSIGWLGGGVAPVAIAVASKEFGFRACLSANSLIYLAFGCLLLWGIQRFMRPRTV